MKKAENKKKRTIWSPRHQEHMRRRMNIFFQKSAKAGEVTEIASEKIYLQYWNIVFTVFCSDEVFPCLFRPPWQRHRPTYVKACFHHLPHLTPLKWIIHMKDFHIHVHREQEYQGHEILNSPFIPSWGHLCDSNWILALFSCWYCTIGTCLNLLWQV